MKAFLMAAGLGTRLRPLTKDIPKCLIPICSKPLLQWWINLFEKHHITEVLINVHHLSDQVIKFLDKNDSKIKFTITYEEVLLGSAGTLIKNQDFIKENEDFFICYSDNLTNFNLSEMLRFHKKNRSIFTMALFNTDKPESCGIAEIDNKNKIINFVEKPENSKNTLANAGIYIGNQEIFNIIPTSGLKDIGYDVLPKLIDNMYGWYSNDYLIDIGTFENLEKANKDCIDKKFVV